MKRIVALFSFIFVCINMHAQIQEGGTPLTKLMKVGTENLPFYQTEDINLTALQQEDGVVDQIKDIPWRYGFIFYVDIDVIEQGEAIILPNLDRISRFKIKSNYAKTINLTFSKYYLQEGAKLFIYSADYSHIIGAFTSKNNKESAYLTTTLVEGNEIVIELYEPASTIGKNKLQLERIVNGYRTLKYKQKYIGDSGSCNNNVVCPEGDPWRNQINSVGILLTQNNLSAGFCSGALVNNTCNDGKPYFLTANHCMQGSSPATIVVGFNFQSTQCNSNSGPYPQNTISGTTLRANNAGSDFALLELSSTPPASYGVYYAGWDHSGSIPLNQIGIHHPAGDLKKITFDNNSASYGTYSGAQCWHISAWDDGTTEGGSSGSPLFNQDGNIIGQLYGGAAQCSNNVDDYYGRFDVSWDNSSSTAAQLKYWLDPCGLNTNTIDGYDPNVIVLSYDASLSILNAPTSDFCGYKWAHSLTLRNRGSEDLTNASILYTVNGNSETYNWSGLLTAGQSVQIDLDSISFYSTNFSYEAYIQSSNLTADEDYLNDTVRVSETLQLGMPVSINLTTNFEPTQNEIILSDINGNMIEIEDGFNSTTSYNFSYCLPEGTYCIEITDSGNDGLSPTFWWDQGNYQLIVNGNEIINTDEIGSGYSYCFIVVKPIQTGVLDNPNVEIGLFPNPCNGIVFMKANQNMQTIEIFDVLGKTIFKEVEINASETTIDLSMQSKGIYFVVVNTEKGKQIEKLILE